MILCSNSELRTTQVRETKLSVYDIAQAGKVVSGPASRSPRKFELRHTGTKLEVISLEAGSIA